MAEVDSTSVAHLSFAHPAFALLLYALPWLPVLGPDSPSQPSLPVCHFHSTH